MFVKEGVNIGLIGWIVVNVEKVVEEVKVFGVKVVFVVVDVKDVE